MRRRPTLHDVAVAAGTHESSASRVLNRPDFGTPELRDRVVRAAHDLGYRPDRRAQGLRRRQTWTIGLLVSDLANAAFLPFVRAAQHMAEDRGYSLVVADGRRRRDVEAETLERFLDHGIDGLLIAGPYGSARVAEQLATHGVAVAPAPGEAGAAWRDHRITTEADATRELVEELVALGHRSILFCTTAVHGGATEDYRSARLRPAHQTCERLGVDFDVLLLDGEGDHLDLATLALEERRLTGTLPSTLICGSHVLAPTLLRACRRLDLQIPDELSFATYGDSEWALAVDPPLSVVRRDFAKEARYLLGCVFATIDHAEPPELDLGLVATYVRRASVAEARR